MADTATAPAKPQGAQGGAFKNQLNRTLPLVVLVLLILVVTLKQPSFLGVPSIRALLDSMAPILLLALGQTFVILTGGIDLSVAVLASFGTVLLAQWIPTMGPGAVLAMLVSLTLIGLLSGLVTAIGQVPSFIVTLGALGLWSGVGYTISGASTITISSGYDAIGWLREYRLAQIPIASWLVIAIAVLAAVAMKVLSRGRSFHAMGLAERAALMSGLPTAVIRATAFALSGLFAGLAALILAASQYSGSPTLADSLLLPVIAAVVLGGTAITGGVGGPIRTLIGALIIAVLRVGLSAVGVDPSFEQIVYGSVVIIAVALTIDRSRLGIVK